MSFCCCCCCCCCVSPVSSEDLLLLLVGLLVERVLEALLVLAVRLLPDLALAHKQHASLLELALLLLQRGLHRLLLPLQIELGLLEARYLLAHLQVEHTLHLALHLDESRLGLLALVLELLKRILVVGSRLVARHVRQLLEAIVLVVHVVGDVLEVLHVRAYEHGAEGHEVAMGELVHVHASPGILATAKGATVLLHNRVAADDGEGQLGLERTVGAVVLDVVVVDVGKLVDLELLLGDDVEHGLLERAYLVGRHGVRLGYDGYEVDAVVQALHDLDIERLERVSGRDEVEAAVDARVGDGQATVHLRLGVEVLVVARIDVVDDGRPAVGVVYGLAEAGRVDDGEAQVDALLGEQGCGGVHGERLLAALEGARKVAGRVELGEEERVDERRLAQARLADHHQVELEAAFDCLAVHLVGQVGEAHVAVQVAHLCQARAATAVVAVVGSSVCGVCGVCVETVCDGAILRLLLLLLRFGIVCVFLVLLLLL